MTRRVSELMSLVTALTLTVLAAVHVAPSQAAPQLLYYNQLVPQVPQVPQVPHLQRHSANVVVVPANAAGIQQFAASGVPLPVGGQYVLVHPGANPVLYVTRAEGEKPENPGTGEGGSGGGSGGGYIDSFVNFVFGFVPANPFPSLTGGTSTPKPTEEEKPTTSDKPNKDEKTAKGHGNQGFGNQRASCTVTSGTVNRLTEM